MERETRARGIPVARGLHDGVRPGACVDSARVIPASEIARFTFAQDAHWHRERHQRIADALTARLAGEPALRRAAAGKVGEETP